MCDVCVVGCVWFVFVCVCMYAFFVLLFVSLCV